MKDLNAAPYGVGMKQKVAMQEILKCEIRFRKLNAV